MCLEATLTKNKTLVLINQGYKILAEYQMIEQKELKSIYAIPSYASGLLWFGVIFIHSGMYSGSVFRFSILLPDNFPEEHILPTVIFQKDIFHPHICPISHSLDLTPVFKEWRKDQHHIWHILKYIQAVFADPEGSVCNTKTGEPIPLTAANNMEAMRLLANNRVDFAMRAKASIIWSCKHMFDRPPINDPHYIIFERYRPEKHQALMKRIKSNNWYALSTPASPPSQCVGCIESTKLLREEDAQTISMDSLN